MLCLMVWKQITFILVQLLSSLITYAHDDSCFDVCLIYLQNWIFSVKFTNLLCSNYRIVDSSEQETASSMIAAFVGIGLACGSALSLGMVSLL